MQYLQRIQQRIKYQIYVVHKFYYKSILTIKELFLLVEINFCSFCRKNQSVIVCVCVKLLKIKGKIYMDGNKK